MWVLGRSGCFGKYVEAKHFRVNKFLHVGFPQVGPSSLNSVLNYVNFTNLVIDCTNFTYFNLFNKNLAKYNKQNSRSELVTLSFTSTPSYHIVKVIELYGNFRQNLIKSSCLLATPSLTLRRQHDFSSEKLWKSLLVWKTLGFLFISGLFSQLTSG